MRWMNNLLSTLFCAILVMLSSISRAHSQRDLETEAILPLGISFTPPSNRVRPGQPLIVRCEITPTDNNAGNAINEVSMFLHCPIAPWNSFCFQNCKSACIGVATGDCPFESQLGRVSCNTIVTQTGRVIYEYTIPDLNEQWIYRPSGNRVASKPPGFYCKSAGLSTVEVWAIPEEPQKVTDPPVPIVTTKAALAEPEDRLPVETTKIENPSNELISNSRSQELEANTSAILRELFVIGAIIIVCISLLLNVFCCVRCALVRQYSRTKRRVLMQNLFCMAEEVETGRRINGLLPGKHVYRATPTSFKDTGSMVEGNGLLLGSLHQNGSEYHQSVHMYPGVCGFSDTISNATGGEAAPSSFMTTGRVYRNGNSGSAFSLPQAGMGGQIHHHQQQQQRMIDSADKQSNATSVVTMPLFQQQYPINQTQQQQQQQQLAVTLATLQQHRQQSGTVPTEMLLIVGPDGQPVTIVSGITGAKARASLVLETSSPPPLPDGISLNSHNTNVGDSYVRVPSVNSNPEMPELRPVRANALGAVLQAQLANHRQKGGDTAPNASHWSDSGNWSGGSAGPPPVIGIAASSSGQSASATNGPASQKQAVQKEVSLDNTSDGQPQLPRTGSRTAHLSSLPRHRSRRSSGHVKRLPHYTGRRRVGSSSSRLMVLRSSPTRDLDVTTEDDVSDWSATDDCGEQDTSSPQTTVTNLNQEPQRVLVYR